MGLLKGLRAVIAAVLYIVTLVVLFTPLAFLGLLYYLIALKTWQRNCKHYMESLASFWVKSNHYIQDVTTSTTWEVKGLEALHYNEWYLLISNHQSWADILVLQRIFNQKIPPLKFFLKKELLWTLPFASWACWLLGFPFMHRYSKKVLAKHPELKNKDIETTKASCMRFKNTPTTVANFIEGTRFSEKKCKIQQSPYQNLLRPKATGIGFSLTVLGDFFHKILNVTIVYPPGKSSLYAFLSGDIKKITVYIETIPITSDWRGDYQNDRAFRATFQKKLNQLWEQKDVLIQKTRANEREARSV